MSARRGTAGRAAAGALLLLAAGLARGGEAAGQLPNPSAAALGVGDNFTAVARGFSAPAWNPAGLGLPDNPRSSFALFSLRGIGGLDPVSPADLAAYQGEALPDAVRAEWLGRIEEEGSQQGTAGVDVSYLAASAGRFAFHLSSSAQLLADFDPEAAELLLFGNAGRTGEPVDLALREASLDMAVTSTVGAAYGQPIWQTEESSFALGAGVNYTIGHILVTGEDRGGGATADPLELRLRFPVAQTDTAFSKDELENGTGVGLDVGALWSRPGLDLAIVVRNVVNTFEWDPSRLYFREGEASFTTAESDAEFAPQPFSRAPTELRERVEALRYHPTLAVGGAYRPRRGVLVSADLRHRLEGSDLFGPATHFGAGVEMSPASWLAARVGAAGLSGGYLVSAGLSLRLGVVDLAVAAASRETSVGTGAIAMFTFSSASR